MDFSTVFFKWTNSGLFLFIFVLFKPKFYRKTLDASGIRTRIVRVEGNHADHLTTPLPLHGCLIVIYSFLISISRYRLTRISLTIVIVFVCCHLPRFIPNIIEMVAQKPPKVSYNPFLNWPS